MCVQYLVQELLLEGTSQTFAQGVPARVPLLGVRLGLGWLEPMLEVGQSFVLAPCGHHPGEGRVCTTALEKQL